MGQKCPSARDLFRTLFVRKSWGIGVALISKTALPGLVKDVLWGAAPGTVINALRGGEFQVIYLL